MFYGDIRLAQCLAAAAARHGDQYRPSALQIEALQKVQEIANRPELMLSMAFQEGDIQLINNYTILHSRTGFVDGPEAHQKRHMLRLWLKFPKPWPLGPDFPSHMGYKPAQDTPVLVEAEA